MPTINIDDVLLDIIVRKTGISNKFKAINAVLFDYVIHFQKPRNGTPSRTSDFDLKNEDVRKNRFLNLTKVKDLEKLFEPPPE